MHSKTADKGFTSVPCRQVACPEAIYVVTLMSLINIEQIEEYCIVGTLDVDNIKHTYDKQPCSDSIIYKKDVEAVPCACSINTSSI